MRACQMLVRSEDGTLSRCGHGVPGPAIRRAPICECCFSLVIYAANARACEFRHFSCAGILIAREARN
jgi:hypothetical protein